MDGSMQSMLTVRYGLKWFWVEVKTEEKRKKWRNNSNIFTLKTFAFVSHLMSFRDIEQLTKIWCWWWAGYYGWKSFYSFSPEFHYSHFPLWNDDARSWLSISSNHKIYKSMSMYLMWFYTQCYEFVCESVEDSTDCFYYMLFYHTYFFW